MVNNIKQCLEGKYLSKIKMHTIRVHFNENILNITEVEVKYLLIIKAKQIFKTPGY